MNQRSTRPLFRLHYWGGFVLLAGVAAFAPSSRADESDFFEKKIRPVLVEHCYECHSVESKEVQGGLLLDNRAAVLRGGDSGTALVAGKPEESLLYQAIQYSDDSLYQMPPAGKLPDEVIADFAEWIRSGAPDPREGDAPPLPAPRQAVDHWAFKPPQLPQAPDTHNAAWPLSELDRHVWAGHQRQGLIGSEEANKHTLLRRVTYDLIGLPPTSQEMAEFLADQSSDAYEKAVDRLLNSPHFGERWARHWLDVARYADTKGYVFQEDRNYPAAYTYRDWVVEALNSDLPYDRFIKYQLAADHMPADGEKNHLPAMGFLTLGRRFLNNQSDIIDDRIDVTTRGLLGLTVSCARCHDHKFDPIPTNDYYSLYGIFASSEEPGGDPSPLRLVDKSNPHDERVFIRGNHRNRGEVVPRRFLECLAGEEREPYREGSGRKQLAEAIASRDNPLTARVMVNRVWINLFGQGLVSSPSDFGIRTERPAQAEALDYLAVKFMDDGWSIKRLIRQIVLSRVYRQSSAEHAKNMEIDPENRLFWRMNRRRLDFEAQRDSLLAAAGTLDRTRGGKSVSIVGDQPAPRRTLYGFIDRQNLPSLFRSFDFSTPDTHSPQRHVTTVPQQALYLLNNEFVQAQAAALAQRSDLQGNAAERIRGLYAAIYQRPPTDSELQIGLDFVADDAPQEVERWQYGYGRYDEASQRVGQFTALAHWTGSAWQAGPQLPDPQHGWAMLHAAGGHPGDNADHAVIRRFTAPSAGELTVRGVLKHPSSEGDGIRAIIVSGRQGALGQWQARASETATELGPISVEEGEQVDFLVDCISGPGWDSFEWSVALSLGGAQGTRSFSTRDGFRGPSELDVDVWALYAQALLLSNEFVFLD